MSNNQKFLLIVAVVITLLFFLGVGIGAHQPPSLKDPGKTSWVQSLQNAIPGAQVPVKAEELQELGGGKHISANMIVLQPKQQCAFTIPQSSSRPHTLKLKLNTNEIVQIDWKQKDKDNASNKLSRDPDQRESSITVLKGGGDLTLTNTGSAIAQIAVQ